MKKIDLARAAQRAMNSDCIIIGEKPKPPALCVLNVHDFVGVRALLPPQPPNYIEFENLACLAIKNETTTFLLPMAEIG